MKRITDYTKTLPIVELYRCVQSEGSRFGRPTIAVRIGDTMFLKPIGSNTIVKIAEDFIARLLHNDNMEGYLIPGEN